MNHSTTSRETAWPDCGQPECGSPSFASLVWPGQGRKHFCVRHWSQVLGVCDAMGMDPNTCDPRRTAEDMIGEAQCFSTSAACAFIETSITPLVAPMTKAAAASA